MHVCRVREPQNQTMSSNQLSEARYPYIQLRMLKFRSEERSKAVYVKRKTKEIKKKKNRKKKTRNARRGHYQHVVGIEESRAYTWLDSQCWWFPLRLSQKVNNSEHDRYQPVADDECDGRRGDQSRDVQTNKKYARARGIWNACRLVESCEGKKIVPIKRKSQTVYIRKPNALCSRAIKNFSWDKAMKKKNRTRE